MTPNHEFDKKIYADQFEFNVKIAGILRKAFSSSVELDKDLHLNRGIELITRRNKLLVLADMHGWEVVEAYTADPLADDSADEKKIRKAKKEGKLLRDQKQKQARMLRAKNREQKKPFRNFQRFNSFGSASAFAASFPVSPNITCWRCGHAGHFAKFCKAPIPTGSNRFFRPTKPGTSQTLINNVDCLTFSDNASCVSDGLPVNCIKELDSNSCPDLGQIDTELG